MNRKLSIIAAIGLTLTGCVTPEQVSYTNDEMNRIFWTFNYTCEDTGITLKTRVFVPANTGKYPIILFLHGAGQKGTDGVSHLYENDIGRLTYYSDKNEKCIIAAPQCPPNKEWTDADILETLDKCIPYIASKIYVADASRIAITGFSMGGIGTYKLALLNPEKYNTLMPICGGPRAWWPKERDEVPTEMDGIGVWAFNNVNDDIVDNMYSKYFISQLWNRENENVHYTELNYGHRDEYVFENKEIMKWFCTNALRRVSSAKTK